MNLRTWKDRFMAVPWIYDCVRPLVVGGIDHGALARFCAVGESDRVFDLGCGTARLAEYLKCQGYLGVDLDAEALKRAARVAGPHARFFHGDHWDALLRDLRPTVVLMIGVVHHLANESFHSIVQRIRSACETPPRIVTLEVAYLPGRRVSNFLGRMDRGRHVRTPDQYQTLFLENDLRISRREIVKTRLGYVSYVGYHLLFEN